MSEQPTRVLVLCTHNSARSQMAEALLRSLGEGRYEVASAGTETTRVNPHAVEVMREVGIDISGARSKHLNEFADREFDYVITVCDSAAEACPMFPGPARRVHWSFPDPSAAGGSDDEKRATFREVRDAISQRLTHWISESRAVR
jgi:arsenate reductase (thioredoxin)